MRHFQKITENALPPMEGVDAAAFLDDFVVLEDTEKPITSG